jgi:hypothetical protein
MQDLSAFSSWQSILAPLWKLYHRPERQVYQVRLVEKSRTVSYPRRTRVTRRSVR